MGRWAIWGGRWIVFAVYANHFGAQWRALARNGFRRFLLEKQRFGGRRQCAPKKPLNFGNRQGSFPTRNSLTADETCGREECGVRRPSHNSGFQGSEESFPKRNSRNADEH